MTTEQTNLAFVKDLYAAFSRGDLPYILERFAPELESFGVTANGRAKAPWHFAGTTRADVARYFEALMGAMEPLRFEPQHYAAAGDHVYATIFQEWKVRKSGKALPMVNGVHRFKVKAGRVVEWFAAEDTQLSVEATA
ncbi:MAG TPA: nuclear transport factor 2 family protein [Polyangia bacterium]|nr:nuclear transport factor 2 family protein [Polyangia bacterium]